MGIKLRSADKKTVMKRKYGKKRAHKYRSLKSGTRRKRIFQLVVNKAAGPDGDNSVRLARKLDRRLKRAGRECHLLVANTWDQFGEMVTSAIRSRPYATVIFGGDGSVRLAASRAVRSKALIGIVPCGRFNSIFHSIYGTNDLEKALEIVRSGYQRRIDAGLANGHFFLGSLVTGLVPGMVERLGMRKLPRIAMGWNNLASHAAEDTLRRRTKIKVDSYTFETEPYLINVHMLSHLMTLHFAPAAVPDDGRITLIYDTEGKRDKVAHYIRDLKKNRYQYCDGVHMIRGERVTISPITGRTWLMDGDAVEFSGNELAIEVLHLALRILYYAPKKS